MSNLKIIDRESYVSFWKNHKGSIFLDASWLQLVVQNNQTVRFYGLYDQDILINAFPVVLQIGRFFKLVTTPPFTPHLGWILPHDNQKLIAVLKNVNAAAIYYPFFNQDLVSNTFVTYQIDLKATVENLHKSLRSDKKRNIKKAEQKQLRVSFEKDYELLENLVQKTFSRQQHEFITYSTLKSIVETYPQSFQVNVWDGLECISSLFLVNDDSVVYYLIGGFDHGKENHFAGPFAMWTAILESKKRGFGTFDFEGSMVPSIASYFASFGAVKKKYGIFQLEKWYFKLFNKLKK